MFMRRDVGLAMYTPPWLHVNRSDFAVDLGLSCAEEESAILTGLQRARRKIGSGQAIASAGSLRTRGSTALSTFL